MSKKFDASEEMEKRITEEIKSNEKMLRYFSYGWLISWFLAIWLWKISIQLFVTGLFCFILVALIMKDNESKKDELEIMKKVRKEMKVKEKGEELDNLTNIMQTIKEEGDRK